MNMETMKAIVHPAPISVGVSNRHAHLSHSDMETLFGSGYALICTRNLSQPGQCATGDSIIIAGPKGCLEQVRILGPVRKQTQVEILQSDANKLGVFAPLRESGHLDGSGTVTLIGPKGSVRISEGLITAKRHIHMTPSDAALYGVSDGQIVQVKTEGGRSLIFDQVVVRISDQYALDFHVDVDEANAAGIKNGDRAWMLKGNFLPGGNIPESLSLITEEVVRNARKTNEILHLKKGGIITPLAADMIRESNVRVVKDGL